MDTKKRSKLPGMFRPFEDLKTILKNRSFKLAPSVTENSGKSRPKTTSRPNRPSKTAISATVQTISENEKELFMEAMANVRPIARNNLVHPDTHPRPLQISEHDGEAESRLQLENLIKYGEGFVVADTSEYIEGTGYNVHPEFTERLHRGDFSIQAHLDLHGLGVEDARKAFEAFFKETITSGKRAVLIVHGRGLSSPARPVLKSKVVEWLTCGPWRKWVIAFTSARSCDGGAGATYVLLRQRPLTRRFRKRKQTK
ncbi:MAG: Smr/MutS family protein [Pseudomonadota bacterium]|uniref:Smr/MutS family protein n=1 Tax=Candidatus Desulfatibia profunda TaxID=2841695 RepID=A0A8J6TIZ3_9BACT|nr:Smr/MutS family protein [Candidatus Desulfatibia profunda]MBL7179972.1 Smr/MutS family protein [Desulfobacterales bacterium]